MLIRRDRAHLPSRDERGAIAIMMALTAVILFVIAGMVVDLGLARDTRRSSQNAADASALAAVDRLNAGGTTTDAANEAVSFAADNFGTTNADWTACTDPGHLAAVSTVSPCISFDSATNPQKARVVMPARYVPSSFGTLVGVRSVHVSSIAEATLTTTFSSPCGMCLLGTGQHDFGTTNLYATGTSVSMNGSLCAKKDFQVSPSPPNTLAVQGGVKTTGGCKSSGVLPYPVTTGTTLTDPLATLAMPSTSGLAVKGTANPCGGTGGPGIYANFSAAAGAPCTLSPGLYVVTGATGITGNGHDIMGTGVTLYFACGTPAAIVACTSANSWDFDMGSQNVHLNLTAATAANAVNGAVPGVAILADRGWTGTLSFQGGGGGGQTQGAIYLKSGTMHYGGNSDGRTLDSLLVVDDFAGNGNSATLNVTDSGANPPLAGPRSSGLSK